MVKEHSLDGKLVSLQPQETHCSNTNIL
jgi:hypothetical protein